MQSDICRQFHENPKRNPRTGKVLQFGKAPYQKLVDECGNPPIFPKTKSPRKPINPIITPSNKTSPIKQQHSEKLGFSGNSDVDKLILLELS